MLYIVLMLHPGLKIMPFKLTGYCRLRLLQTEVKRRKIQAKKEKNAKFVALLNEIAGHFSICSQLETLEKRAIIYNFIL